MAAPIAHLAFFLSFSALLLLSLTFTLLTWRTYRSTLAENTPLPCTLTNVTCNPCPDTPGGYFISGTASLSSPSSTLPVYYTAPPPSCPFRGRSAPGCTQAPRLDGRTQTCYRPPLQATYVRLVADPPIHAARLHAVLAILATIISAAVLVYGEYHLLIATRRRRHRTSPPPAWRDAGFAAHPRAPPAVLYVDRAAYTCRARRPLSAADAHALVSSLRKGDGRKEVTCVICLEEVEVGGVLLPCAHEFHEVCVRQWFRKGGALCPCCKYDLAEEVEEVRQRAVRERKMREDRITVVQVAGEEEGDRDADADEDGDGVEEEASWASWGSYVWGWGWWNRDDASQTTSEDDDDEEERRSDRGTEVS